MQLRSRADLSHSMLELMCPTATVGPELPPAFDLSRHRLFSVLQLIDLQDSVFKQSSIHMPQSTDTSCGRGQRRESLDPSDHISQSLELLGFFPLHNYVHTSSASFP